MVIDSCHSGIYKQSTESYNAGVGMLAKMLSSGTKASSVPKPAITGPERVNSTQWVMTYTFKQGVMKYGIKSQFSFAANKIAMIHSSRI